MPAPKRITIKWLRRRKVCDPDQLSLFERYWPKGCAFTPENVLEAARIGLKVSWISFLVPMNKWAYYVDELRPILTRHVAWASRYQPEIAPILISYLWPQKEERTE